MNDPTENTPSDPSNPSGPNQPAPATTVHWIITEVRFELGRLLATQGAVHMLEAFQVNPVSLVARHVAGDWGDLCEEDRALNEASITSGARIMSSYRLQREEGEKTISQTVWVITDATDGGPEGDRPCTTILLPSEY
jgi:hypothetical protein